MLTNGGEPNSPTSNGGSDITALLEQELDAISLPGSPKTPRAIEELDAVAAKTARCYVLHYMASFAGVAVLKLCGRH